MVANSLLSAMLILAAAVMTACAAGSSGEATPEIEARDTVGAIGTVGPTVATTPQSFQVYSSQDAIDAFIAAGLEADAPTPLEVDGHSPLPPTFVEALRFQMPSFGDRTGRVFSFESPADLKAVKAYYEGFTDSQASLVFVKENLLLQISADVPAGTADAYRSALDNLAG